MRPKRAAGKRRGSGRRNNDVSRISEVKDVPNVAVRRRRGRRAPPPPRSRSLRGKVVDKAVDSDDAVDSDTHDTDEDQAGIRQSADINDVQSSASEEQEKETDTRRSTQDAINVKPEGVASESTGQEALANEDGSNAQAAVVKKATDAESSPEIKDDVSDVQAKGTSSEDRSSEEVEDVKVCDICGDVGDEDKLAVCSRCNDGAEHTYCMRVMMEEVPENEWLCEDCQTEVELKKENKLAKSKGLDTADGGNDAVNSRMEEDAAVTPLVRETIPEPGSLSMGVDSRKRMQPSRENSFKSKGVDTADGGNDAVNSRMEEDAAVTPPVRETIPEPGSLSMGVDSRKRMQPSRESSFKFDVDKGKQLNHQVAASLPSNSLKNQAPQPRGQLSKSTSFNNSKVPKVKPLVNEVPNKPKNLKEPWSSIIKKEATISMTTKSATFKKPKPSEPANKTKSFISSPAEESRIMNPMINRNVTNDRGSSILGCPSDTATIAGTVPSKAETTAHHVGTANNIGDSNNLSIGQGGKNSLGTNELKKSLLAKGPGSSMLSSAERSTGILGSGAQRKVVQNSDPSQRDNKIKDQPSFRPGASSSNLIIRCQRCNEVGHSTEFCAVDKLRLSAIKPFSERNLKDASANRNRTSETSTLVATEKTDSRSADRAEEIPKYGLYQNPIYGPKDALSASLSHVKKPTPLSVRTDEQHMRSSMSTPGSTTPIDCSKPNFKDDHPTQSSMRGRSVDNGYTVPSDRRDKSSEGFSTCHIPELHYIWQGGFELKRTGRSPELCDGFQAHLSCSASQSVLEVAKKFPSNVQLEELPRQTSWPPQFQGSGPTYNNVGLFFFARDSQSYENYYSKLVENMLKNDLVLRGTVDAVELLIFPSNILSKNFQRWNTFYFLWGVFRVSRKNGMKLTPDLATSRRESNLNEGPRAADQSTSGHTLSKDMNNASEPAPNLVKPATCTDHQCVESLQADHRGSLNGESSFNRPAGQRPLDDYHDSVTARCSTDKYEGQKLGYSGHEDKMHVTFDANVSERDFDVNKVPVACSVSLIHRGGKESTFINLNNAEDLMDIDLERTTEVNTGVSGCERKRSFDMALGTGEVDGALVNKKIKLDNIVSASSDLNENIKDGKLSSKVHPVAASSVDDGTDHKAMAGSSNSDGKRIFPLDLNAVDEEASGNVVNVRSSNDEELPEPDVRDIDLERCEGRSPGKVSPKVGEKLPTETAGSLSRPLAFPSGKKQVIKL
ncbi:hypothetical protein ACP4OV_026215 [Aristida adscensionis]